MSRLALAALAAIAITVGGVLVLTERTAYAATITVDSLDDVIADDGECTLREAIENANDTTDGQPHDDCAAGNPAGEDLIVFSVAGTIVLVAGELPQVDEDLVIDGSGDIEIDAASSSRILALGAANLTLQGLTLTNGQTDEAGGAIVGDDGGNLTIIDSSFIANNAPGGGVTLETGSGGAIALFSGDLVVTGSTFAENGAEADGGAIYAAGVVEIDDSLFEDNSAGGNGGAIWVDSPNEPDQLELSDVTFASNRAALSGGAIYSANHTDLDGVTAEDNEAEEHGGALYVTDRTVDVVDSTFVLNVAGEDGGAIYLDSGFVDVHNSTFDENEALGSGGALASSDASVEVLATGFEGNVAGTDGGAIFGDGSTLTVMFSEFHLNEATGNGGAIAVTNRTEPGIELAMFDSTVSENSATNGGGIFLGVDAETEVLQSTLVANEASVHGGAIYNESAHSIWNSTLTGNVAGEEGGAILNDGVLELRNVTFYANTADDGGAIRTLEDSETEITNTVVAASVDVDNCSFDEDPTGVDESNISDDDSCGEPLFVEVDDVELGDLENNGGPTHTHLPADTSPLVDAGDTASCPGIDQRGEDRPVGEGCDIGAVELQDPLAPTPTPTTTPGPTPSGDLFVPQIARDVQH